MDLPSPVLTPPSLQKAKVGGNWLVCFARSLRQWVDADHASGIGAAAGMDSDRVDWVRCAPFIAVHLGCLGVLWVGTSPTAIGVAVALYVFRMLAVTGAYHRYFSHKTYRTSRLGQFLLALWGTTTAQRGPLWWAAHHRHHHEHSDQPGDIHSPRLRGFLWSHIGWITSRRNFRTDYARVPDLARYPELVFLNRFDSLVPVLLAAALWAAGWALERAAPGLHTGPWQLVVWGFCVSTTVLFHATSCINSLAHVFGRQRFDTGDDSRNSLALAVLTLGEGWHNNHHRHQASARQGFYWWELDITYWALRALALTGLIWDLKEVPARVYAEAARGRPPARSAAT
jgi:stearoyl-CoA desaturase (Delta-9 desaturase)